MESGLNGEIWQEMANLQVNAEDYAGAAELVADDMMAYFIGMPPTGMEIYWGKAQFQTFLEECCTGQHFEWEVVPTQVVHSMVYAKSKTWMDFTRELGVAPNDWHEIFAVEDGKITLYVSMITEEALARFKPAIFEAIPELATAVQSPAASDETPISELTITLANGTCAYDGPMTLQAGPLPVHVVVEDQDWEKYFVSFFTLDQGKDQIDLMASTHSPGPPSLWSRHLFLKELEPGDSKTYNGFAVQEGLLYMVCWAGSPNIAIGNAGTVCGSAVNRRVCRPCAARRSSQVEAPVARPAPYLFVEREVTSQYCGAVAGLLTEPPAGTVRRPARAAPSY
jgi:hypothetical protein